MSYLFDQRPLNITSPRLDYGKFRVMKQNELNQIMTLLEATVSGHAYTQIHDWAKSNLELYQIRTNVVKKQTITMP